MGRWSSAGQQRGLTRRQLGRLKSLPPVPADAAPAPRPRSIASPRPGAIPTGPAGVAATASTRTADAPVRPGFEPGKSLLAFLSARHPDGLEAAGACSGQRRPACFFGRLIANAPTFAVHGEYRSANKRLFGVGISDTSHRRLRCSDEHHLPNHRAPGAQSATS